MWSRFIFLIFFVFVQVHCGSERESIRRQFGEGNIPTKSIREDENLGSTQSTFNDGSQFSNSRGVNSPKGSDRLKEQSSYTSNVREDERATVTESSHSLERATGDSYNRDNNHNRPQGASTHHSNTDQYNNRPTGTGGQSFGSRPIGESSQFSNNREGDRYPSGQNTLGRPSGVSSGLSSQARPSNHGESISGRPTQGSAHHNQQTNSRPANEGNNFSGRPSIPSNEGHSSDRPTEGSTFSQPGGFRPGNEGQSSVRPSEGSTFGQSSGFRPGNEGHSSARPSGGSTFGQSSGFRPNNEGHSSARPSEGSTFGQTSGFRPNNEGHSSARPSEGSTFGQTSGFRPNNEGHSSARPSEGSTFGQSSGFRPGNEGHSSGRPGEGSTFGQSSGLRPSNEGHSSGRPSEASTFGQPSGFRPGNEGQSSGIPHGESGFGHPSGHVQEGQTGSVTQRPGSSKEQEHSQTGNRPNGEQNQNTEDGKEDEKDVCFTHLGCFKMGKPWKSTLRPVGAPHAPEKIQTVVHFYSRQNPKQPQNITVYPQVKMGRAQFDPQKISAIIVHGFSNSGNASWMKDMKDVYLRKVDANVMIVDWGKGAQLLNYLQVAGNTRVVGKQLGTFVRYLIEQYGADPGRFHLIGHSLGAQICSYLAKDVPGIARLTALDPAQPGFEGFSKEVRLDQTDAEFVDVIHTDARPFIPTLGFGMMAPHGHVDFYMNGGFDQPGCIPPPKKDLPVIKSFLDFAKFPVETIAKAVACPHARAYEYLIEAFNETDNCIFWGHKTDVKNVFKTVTNTVTQGLFKKFTALSTTCSKDDCIPLGFATKKSPLRGAFVVTTSGRSPYCISEKGVPPETLPKDRKRKSVIQKIRETSILG